MKINIISVGHYFKSFERFSRFGVGMRKIQIRKNINNTIHLVYED